MFSVLSYQVKSDVNICKNQSSEDDQGRHGDRKLVEKEGKSVGLMKEDARNRARWRVGVGEIAGRVG